MKNNFLSILLIVFIAITFTSCIKDNVDDLKEGDGTSFLKVIQAPENKLFFSPFSDVKPVTLLTLKRDVTSNSELNTQMSVKIEANEDSIVSYNTSEGTTYEPLPDSLFTLGTGVTKTGNIYTVTLNPGEFQKDLVISLNGSKWDLSHTYAVAFKIVDPAGLKISTGNQEIISLLSVKNKYDGVYKIEGTFSDASNSAFVGAYPLEWELQTSGPYQCIVFDNVELGFPGYLFETGGGLSYFGSFGLIVNFDPSTDKIESVTNYYGQPAANTRSAQLDPTGINAYDAATKTISIKYFMIQPSVITTPPNIRGMFNETWTYIRER